jgi:hypothetical protein
LVNGFPCGDPLAGHLSTAQGVVGRWCEPIGQDREGSFARLADPAPNPETFMLVVMALAKSAPVADDRVVLADWTSPGQAVQRDHPGSMLSFDSGSAIKRITAGVKARR